MNSPSSKNNVIRKLGIASALLALSVLFSTQQANSKTVKTAAAPSGGNNQCQNLGVTTNVLDADGLGNPYDTQSDGLGSYQNGVAGVTSWLVCNGYNKIQHGDWQFDTYSSTTRKVQVNVDTEDAIQPGDPHFTTTANPPFWGGKLDKGHIEVKCTLANNDMLTMTAGQAFTCPLIIRFPAAIGSSTDYRLVPGKTWSGWPETTDVWVACNAANSGGCSDWTITPIGGQPAVARMALSTSMLNNYGDWYLQFQYHITRP